ncbi:MAG: hypothetical protein KGZ88_05595 [Methylomicrobium sp.]|nr:hypothetical protein [Methylomicrobium sp.]
MDKTLTHHKVRRHPLYKSGEEALTRLPDCPLQKRPVLINHWLRFCVWSTTQDGNQLDSIVSVTRDHVIRYGQYLKSEFDLGKRLSTAGAASSLSFVNAVMRLMDNDWQTVGAVTDCGIQPCSHIPTNKLQLDKNGLPDSESLAGYLLELQSVLGVTVREALLLDLKKSLIEGRTTGFVTVTHYQNGVRRKVPCRPAAIKALGSGIAARRLQKRLPKKWAFDDFLAAYNKLAARKGYSTNTARGHYARDRYRELTGVEPPILSDLSPTDHWHAIAQHTNKTLSEAKGLDKNSRHAIAKELGLLGIETVSSFLDK